MTFCSALKGRGVPVRRAFVGIVSLAALSSLVLFVLERKYSKATARLEPLARALVPSSCTPDPDNDGLYVHLDCPVKAATTFSPPFQFAKNVSPFRGAWFEVRAEMFQPTNEGVLRSWTRALASGGGALNRRMGWFDHLVAGSSKAQSALYFPAVPGLGRQIASSISIGDFSLPSKTVGAFRQSTKLDLTDDGVYSPQQHTPPKTLDSQSTRVYDGCLYSGSPWSPKAGDMRVCFFGSKATHASLIGLQQRRPLSGVREIADGEEDLESTRLRVPQGKPFFLFAEGDWSPSELLAKHIEELGYPQWFVWSWRTTAFVFLFSVFASVAAFAEEEEAPWLLRWISKGQPCVFVLLKCLCMAASLAIWITAAATAPSNVALSKRLLILAGGFLLAALILRLIGYRVSLRKKNSFASDGSEDRRETAIPGGLCSFASPSLPSVYEGVACKNTPLLTSCSGIGSTCLQKTESSFSASPSDSTQILRWSTAPPMRSFSISQSAVPSQT